MFPTGSWLNDQRKIGLGLTAFGFLFTFLGILLFFDRGLLAMGNLLFMAGMTITIGVQATVQFFSRRKNRKGSAFYLSGAGLVIIGWTVIGLCLEAYGFWLLFCEFLPTVLQFSRRVPFMSKVLEVPFLKAVMNKLTLMGGLPTTMEDANGRSR